MTATEDIARLAYTVADPRRYARLIGPDNENVGEAPLPDALAGDHAFAVYPRFDIVVLDQDDPGSEPALWMCAEVLERRGVLPVVVASGGNARHHLWAKVPDPALRTELVVLARKHGIDARIQTPTRPPLSRHRHL